MMRLQFQFKQCLLQNRKNLKNDFQSEKEIRYLTLKGIFGIFSSRQLVIVFQREPQGLKSLDRKVSEPWEDEALKAKEEDDFGPC